MYRYLGTNEIINYVNNTHLLVHVYNLQKLNHIKKTFFKLSMDIMYIKMKVKVSHQNVFVCKKKII